MNRLDFSLFCLLPFSPFNDPRKMYTIVNLNFIRVDSILYPPHFQMFVFSHLLPSQFFFQFILLNDARKFSHFLLSQYRFHVQIFYAIFTFNYFLIQRLKSINSKRSNVSLYLFPFSCSHVHTSASLKFISLFFLSFLSRFKSALTIMFNDLENM